jgi:AmiR/NasT family two-component response regulator
VTARGLRVLVADEDPAALDALAAMLRSLEHEVSSYAIEVADVSDHVVRDDPDLSIVVLHRDDDHALALVEEICSYASGPVLVLTQADDAGFVARAAERGVASYGKPTAPQAIQSAIEIAVHSHAERKRLESEVDQLESALERRAAIERAKGILMERHGVDERAAFERLRTHARSTRRRVVDVAREVAQGSGEPA